MRIYITGVAGMLGANIAYELRNKHEVYGADLFDVAIPKVQTEVLDLCNYNQLFKSIKSQKPQVVIHTVAAVNVDQCEIDVEYAHKLNCELTSMVLEICRKERIHLIYISTDAVFDGENQKLYDEKDEVNPINVYGRTKYEGEQIVANYNLCTIIRTNIYGFNLQDKKSFGEWILYSLLNSVDISMFTDITFSPILVNELANIIDLIINKKIYGLYHVCGTGTISKYDFGVKLKETFNIKTGSIQPSLSTSFDFTAKRSKNMALSNHKICKKLSVNISTPYESIQKFKELYDNGFSKLLKSMR